VGFRPIHGKREHSRRLLNLSRETRWRLGGFPMVVVEEATEARACLDRSFGYSDVLVWTDDHATKEGKPARKTQGPIGWLEFTNARANGENGREDGWPPDHGQIALRPRPRQVYDQADLRSRRGCMW